MLDTELKGKSSLELCRYLGQSVEKDIKQRNLLKRDVARQAHITEVTLHRICTGQNVKLDSVIRVLQVIDRDTALQALITPLPPQPMSMYKEMLKERKRRSSGRRVVKTQSSRTNKKPVTALDIRKMCE